MFKVLREDRALYRLKVKVNFLQLLGAHRWGKYKDAKSQKVAWWWKSLLLQTDWTLSDTLRNE